MGTRIQKKITSNDQVDFIPEIQGWFNMESNTCNP